MDDRPFLVADVGGTNTRVGLARGRDVDPRSVRRYANREFANLGPVLRRYRDETGGPSPKGACIAMAGPVADGVAHLTNLDWSIDITALIEATDAGSGAILNDLQAQGHALGHLASGSVRTVCDGPRREAAPRLVIGVGTGFNAVSVYDAPSGRIVPASEAGHANLPIRTEAELRLCTHLSTAHGFAAVEDVLSGRGLERVYHWLALEAGASDERRAADIMADLDTDPRARAALRLFVSMLGRVAGNLALIHLPFGGIVLVGGVARAVSGHLREMGFIDSFRDKGRFAGFMTNFAIDVVEDDFAALTGCAAHLTDIAAQTDGSE
ncbi:glucokinase [Jannaschia sp. LMIT008]|uniref:glucokinase n=1 Tax=Jannaschia maritima TaxID=3032585 RepID=UPI00281151A1|nr:glucokinase [Jannaschia sp. LMIT008]